MRLFHPVFEFQLANKCNFSHCGIIANYVIFVKIVCIEVFKLFVSTKCLGKRLKNLNDEYDHFAKKKSGMSKILEY